MPKLNKIFSWKILNLIPYLTGSILFIIMPAFLLFFKVSNFTWKEIQNWEIINSTTQNAISRSVYLGLIASFLGLCLIFPFTWIVARSKSKFFQVICLTLMISPIFIFSIAKIFALKILFLKILDTNNLPSKQPLMILGMIYLYSPYMAIPLYSVIKMFPQSLLDAAHDLGDNKFKSIFKVVVPYCSKAIFASVAIMFMLSATTLIISKSFIDDGLSSNHTRMIGNIIDQTATSTNLNKYSAMKTSTVSLLTICVMVSVYATIYFLPQVYLKLKKVFYG